MHYLCFFLSKNINQSRDENIIQVSCSFEPSMGLQRLAQHLFSNKSTKYWLCSIGVMGLQLCSLVFLISFFHTTGISNFLKQKSDYAIACKDMHVTKPSIHLSHFALIFCFNIFLYYFVYTAKYFCNNKQCLILIYMSLTFRTC